MEENKKQTEIPEQPSYRRGWQEYAQQSLFTLLTVIIAILFYHLIQYIGEISGFFRAILSGISPVIWGLVLAYLLSPVAAFYERNLTDLVKSSKRKPKKKKKPDDPEKTVKRVRVVSSILTVLTAITFIILLLWIVVPEISKSITGIVKELPSQIERLTQQLKDRTFFNNDTEMGAYANEAILSALQSAEEWLLSELPARAQVIGSYFFSGVKGVFSVIYNLFVGLVLSLYITIDKEKLKNQFRQVAYTILPTRTAFSAEEMFRRGNTKLSAAIHGKMLDSFIIGMIHFILLSFANLMPWFNYPYPVLLAVIVGVTNVVPFFGPIVGGFITGVLVLFENPSMVIPYLIIILALQQFDGNFLDPHIVGGRIGLRPFWSIFGCLLGSAVLGVPGFVLGPPTMAFFYEIASDWTDRNLRKKHLEETFHLRPKEELERETEEANAEKVPEIRAFGEMLHKGREKTAEVIEKLRNDD